MSLTIERETERKPMLGAIKSAIFGAVPASSPRRITRQVETQHQKVHRLIDERRIEEAASLAAGLINNNNDDGFFIYAGTPQFRRAQQWYEDRVSASRRGQVAQDVETITPEMAQVLLQHNEGNRRVDRANLAQIMRDVVSGKFTFNGENVKVSKEGLLNDGQHRNFAALLSGSAIRTAVIYGVDRESRNTVDIGRKRQAKDRLAIKGETDYIVLSAIATLAFEMDHGRGGTAAEVDEYFSENADSIRTASKLVGQSIRGCGPSITGVTAIHLTRLGAKPDDIKRFFKIVRDNEGTASGDAARTIHRALFPNTGKPPLRMKKLDWVSTLSHHFILWRRNKQSRAPIVGQPLPEKL